MKKSISGFCFLFLMFQPAIAQIQNAQFEAKILYGSILPHYSFMNYLITEPQKGIEFQFRTNSNPHNLSSFLYRNPSYGIAFNHTSLGNPSALGYTSSIFGVLDIPILQLSRFSLLYQCNLGFTYVHKPLSKSIHNIAISSPFNFLIGLDLIGQYQLSENHDVRLGIDFTHFSNGKIRTPNLGYNSLAISGSYVYHIQKTEQTPRVFDRNNLPPHHVYKTIWSGGLKADEYLNTNRYLTSSFIIEYQRLFNYKYAFVLGTDVFYDATKNTESKFNGGVHTGVEIFYMPLGFTMQGGLYLWNIPEEQFHFFRIAIRYYATKSYILQLGLKTHTATADFLEIGVGYTIPNIRAHVLDIQK